MHRAFQRQSSGLTLIEVLLVVVILGILGGVAAPAYVVFVEDRRIQAEANRLVSLFKLVRSEARARARTVTLSRSANWNGPIRGYVAVAGPNREFAAAVDQLLRTENGSNGSLMVNGSQAADSWISFGPRGWLSEDQPVTIAICPGSGDSTRGVYVEINPVGRISKTAIDSDARGCTPP